MSLSSSLPRRPRAAAFLLTFAALATSATTAHADEPAPPAKAEAPAKAEPKRSAGITVHVVEGARVLVDRADAGRAEPGKPFELTLPPGDYTVRVVYDGGGNEKRKVLVTEGHVTDIDFRELPELRLLFEKRERWVLGFQLGAGAYLPDTKGGFGPQFEGGAIFNRALSKAVDFRVLLGVHGWVAVTRGLDTIQDRQRALALAVTAEPGFLFRLGGTYTMGVSVAGRLGVAIPFTGDGTRSLSPYSYTGFIASGAARISPAGFAFGENREHHIELVGGVAGSTVRGFGLDMGELRYSLLLL